MIIRDAMIYSPDHSFVPGDLYIDGERLTASSANADGEIVEATGLYALPGLLDLHFHGAVGYDLCDADPAGLQAIADFEAQHGVTAICPATMTFPEEKLREVMRCAAAHRNGQGADLVGINMEGPFINPDKAGAQDPQYVIQADVGMLERLQEAAGGLIRLVDVAPEIPGNLDFIRQMSDQVRISIAHTKTDYGMAAQAFKAGAKQLTHTYNAMPPMAHREPGPIPAGAEYGSDAELIADGIHVHPAMVRLLFRLYGPEHILLISDSMRACGLPDGDYTLGGQAVTVRGKKAVLTEKPDTIAGSVTCLYDCMREAVINMGIPLEHAVQAASENPARALGVSRDYGTLSPGAYANVILADMELTIRAVYLKGKKVR